MVYRPESMIRLIYTSTATEGLGNRDIRSILVSSRRKNPGMQITGLLLYHHGMFIQTLEGPSDQVEQLMERIGRDTRHRDVIHISVTPITFRLFDRWAMAFEDVEKVAQEDIPGYSNFLEHPLDPRSLAEDPSSVIGLMRAFRENRLVV